MSPGRIAPVVVLVIIVVPVLKYGSIGLRGSFWLVIGFLVSLLASVVRFRRIAWLSRWLLVFKSFWSLSLNKILYLVLVSFFVQLAYMKKLLSFLIRKASPLFPRVMFLRQVGLCFVLSITLSILILTCSYSLVSVRHASILQLLQLAGAFISLWNHQI